MAIKIKADDLAKTVQGLIDKFGVTAESVMADAVWKTAGTVVKDLKKSGSFGGTGEYKKSWSRKLTKKRLYATATVYNKEHGSLTHLLEFGHVIKSGGRVVGSADAFPHIAPVNDRVPDIFVDEFTDLLAEALIDKGL